MIPLSTHSALMLYDIVASQPATHCYNVTCYMNVDRQADEASATFNAHVVPMCDAVAILDADVMHGWWSGRDN